MKTTTPTTITIAAAVAVVAIASLATHASAKRTAPDSIANRAALLERGRYLVENVGMCADCHTPRTEKGEFDRSRWLLGSALPFQPTVPMPWSPAAPAIAGLPTMTEPEAIDYMQSGRRPNGAMALPPMPEFRFNAEDAAAVVAYLKAPGH
jgi:mono/diheme cytochrome c family protein